MARTALITGISGQDGSYLAELLLEKGYDVHGMLRRSSNDHLERVKHLAGRLHLCQGDLLDQNSLVSLLAEIRPDEVYNLGAQSFVPTSWEQAIFTAEVAGLGVTRLLDAIRQTDAATRFYRPAEVELLLVDPGKAHDKLGWRPQKSFEALVTEMVDADMARLGGSFRTGVRRAA